MTCWLTGFKLEICIQVVDGNVYSRIGRSIGRSLRPARTRFVSVSGFEREVGGDADFYLSVMDRYDWILK